ncbi:hypothetical protein DTO013E5_9901 [Penicillium roqueforti]|uniref:uncharacterized protein n=1 Tax=Penicillium roqueforti TaxID=5082 RepID=UPI001909D481|nr:uncharacterized protein LCP9604111_5151 [Penicillium roqueforti]KAF9248401.1 hypothetical protein LCP9604111_5151 [Penicillium roqueforti]KAI1829522.1 hypothetical protein CBS147337_9672 [Penicillium roqueforti]KAI2682238.1 hypothetical protein LCP963914a_6653 [Penicillium roqueforti]KAI2694717.1 hypothetical protein CBS147372_9633 [Penicillium roqueforti]KAI2713060.1 hypothetical protein CBS147318_7199 [Penicillium roqueforti]
MNRTGPVTNHVVAKHRLSDDWPGSSEVGAGTDVFDPLDPALFSHGPIKQIMLAEICYMAAEALRHLFFLPLYLRIFPSEQFQLIAYVLMGLSACFGFSNTCHDIPVPTYPILLVRLDWGVPRNVYQHQRIFMSVVYGCGRSSSFRNLPTLHMPTL